MAAEPGDLDDDLPSLVGDSDTEGQGEAEEAPPLPPQTAAAAAAAAPASANQQPEQEGGPSAPPKARKKKADFDGVDGDFDDPPSNGNANVEAEGLLAADALRKAALEKSQAEGDSKPISASDALRGLLAETNEEAAGAAQAGQDLSATTLRMVQAITKDDFEECEDAIMQGADVNADCGAGMRALHLAALRGELFLTELLIAHGAKINERDMSGNTPLLYACHFYRQHSRGVQMVSQLLHHKADPWYQVRDGKLAGKTAYDLMDKSCHEPNTDENVPRQMRAMLQLAMDDKGDAHESITKVWMSFKSQNKKLYQVSSKKDSYNYVMKNLDWDVPEQDYAPVKLETATESALEEKFVEVKDYLFSDEGDKVKIYITFPEAAAAAFAKTPVDVEVNFEMETVDVKLRGASEAYRMRVEPLYGTIEASDCKHRVSAGSRKITLTLAKRHKTRRWPTLQKPR